jgi:heptosyltransferase-1
MHAVERTRALFALALGYPLRATTGDYGLRDSFPATAAELPPGLLFFHGTARDEKLWPEAHWVELAALAAESGYRVWLPWGNAKERDRAQRIAAVSVAAEVLPALSLRELAGMLCQVAGAVAVDTGLGHLAAALDVPTVSLYGPTSTKLIGAYGRNQLHLESPLTHASGSDAHARMAAISAPSVWQALGELLPLAGKPTGPLAGQGS